MWLATDHSTTVKFGNKISPLNWYSPIDANMEPPKKAGITGCKTTAMTVYRKATLEVVVVVQQVVEYNSLESMREAEFIGWMQVKDEYDMMNSRSSSFEIDGVVVKQLGKPESSQEK